MPRYRKQPKLNSRMRRAVLNATSRKKQDNMTMFTNTTVASPTGGGSYTAAPAILAASTYNSSATSAIDRTGYVFVFCPTARNLSTAGDVGNNVINEAQRTATDCYMVGYKENIEIQINDGCPWQWRRICFRTKGNVSALLSGANERIYQDASLVNPPSNDGMLRVVNALSGNRNAGSQYNLYEIIFEGQNASDWVDPMTAITDKKRITVMSDTTRTIRAGNESGTIQKFSRYYRLNKTLVYNDDEAGEVTATNYLTSPSAGMGDFYVVDIFRARFGNQNSTLYFTPHAKLYWHEK